MAKLSNRDEESDWSAPEWTERLGRRTAPVIDWLGATKPLHLICGACGVIAVVSAVAQAVS